MKVIFQAEQIVKRHVTSKERERECVHVCLPMSLCPCLRDLCICSVLCEGRSLCDQRTHVPTSTVFYECVYLMYSAVRMSDCLNGRVTVASTEKL